MRAHVCVCVYVHDPMLAFGTGIWDKEKTELERGQLWLGPLSCPCPHVAGHLDVLED